jgi:hypothetical protein
MVFNNEALPEKLSDADRSIELLNVFRGWYVFEVVSYVNIAALVASAFVFASNPAPTLLKYCGVTGTLPLRVGSAA